MPSVWADPPAPRQILLARTEVPSWEVPEAGSPRKIVAARACAGERHRFSPHSNGNEFSMRLVFALYVCIVALGVICGIAASVA